MRQKPGSLATSSDLRGSQRHGNVWQSLDPPRAVAAAAPKARTRSARMPFYNSGLGGGHIQATPRPCLHQEQSQPPSRPWELHPKDKLQVLTRQQTIILLLSNLALPDLELGKAGPSPTCDEALYRNVQPFRENSCPRNAHQTT